MSAFSLVLDYPWWIAAGFFGAASAAIVYLPRRMLASRVRIATAVAFFALMLWAGAYFFTFSVRIDERGAMLSSAAPFQPAGAMRWEDVARIEIVQGAPGFSPYELRMVSRAGQAIEIPLSELPADTIRGIARMVSTYARRAEFAPSEEEFVSEADRIAAKGWWLPGLLRARS